MTDAVARELSSHPTPRWRSAVRTMLGAVLASIGLLCGTGAPAGSAAPFSLAFFAEGRVQVAASSALNPPGELTVETWVKPAQTVGKQVLVDRLSVDARGAAGGYQLSLQDGRLAFVACTAQAQAARGCATVMSATVVRSGVWQHVAAMFSGSDLSVYVDGQRQATMSLKPTVLAPSNGVLTLGAGQGGAQRFNGLLDEVRIARAAAYGANFSPPPQVSNGPQVVGLWRFDGGSVADQSAYGHATAAIGSVTFSTDVPSASAIADFVRTDTPNVGPKNRLNDVATTAPDRAWAVGFHGPATTCCFPATPVALRWDGKAWLSTPVPYPAGYAQGQLLSVAAARGGGEAVWALGTLRAGTVGGVDRGWLLKWDGAAWQTLAVFNDPELPGYGIGTVRSLAVVDENQVWVVGSRISGASWTLRWDGSLLQTVASPNADMGGNGLFDIAVVSPTQIYAVGSFIAMRWDGASWQIVNTSTLRNYHLRAVAAASASEIWIVARGTTCGPFAGCSSGDLLLRFDGSTVATAAIEPFTQNQVILENVSVSGPGDVWVVGTADNKGLVLHLEDGVFRRKQTEPSPPATIDYDRLLGVSALSPSVVFAVGYATDVYYEPQYRSTDTSYALRGRP